MPTVTIDGQDAHVDKGTNLIDAARQLGIQIPHYCYHPRLSVVGQCRMCLVKVEGSPKLQAACSTEVVKNGMVVLVDDPEVQEAQEGVMEFLLINHPLDCPICDQAGECDLQDYSFQHGQAFSRFAYEAKRTYPGRERIPLGPHVVLNMNRCIQCTRCIRFTEEITGTSELGFFERGARTEIGVFPGKELDNPLSACVVDLCPVGALTSTDFRFAERVWYLDKVPSLCTGCDVGCNISLEHRRGSIKRYQPRVNPEVNDYWLCDYGRSSFHRYEKSERLTSPKTRDASGEAKPIAWSRAQGLLFQLLLGAGRTLTVLGSPGMTTEEAFLLACLAGYLGSPHRAVWTEKGPERSMPNPHGGLTGNEAAPNRRGVELAGMVPGADGLTAQSLVEGQGAAGCKLVLMVDGDPGSLVHDEEVVSRLRQAEFLAVIGWAETPLTKVADLALPCADHAEKEGTFVNVESRIQRFDKAYPAPGECRSTVEILLELLVRFDRRWQGLGTPQVFESLASGVLGLPDAKWEQFPELGLQVMVREPNS